MSLPSYILAPQKRSNNFTINARPWDAITRAMFHISNSSPSSYDTSVRVTLTPCNDAMRAEKNKTCIYEYESSSVLVGRSSSVSNQRLQAPALEMLRMFPRSDGFSIIRDFVHAEPAVEADLAVSRERPVKRHDRFNQLPASPLGQAQRDLPATAKAIPHALDTATILRDCKAPVRMGRGTPRRSCLL